MATPSRPQLLAERRRGQKGTVAVSEPTDRLACKHLKTAESLLSPTILGA